MVSNPSLFPAVQEAVQTFMLNGFTPRSLMELGICPEIVLAAVSVQPATFQPIFSPQLAFSADCGHLEDQPLDYISSSEHVSEDFASDINLLEMTNEKKQEPENVNGNVNVFQKVNKKRKLKKMESPIKSEKAKTPSMPSPKPSQKPLPKEKPASPKPTRIFIREKRTNLVFFLSDSDSGDDAPLKYIRRKASKTSTPIIPSQQAKANPTDVLQLLLREKEIEIRKMKLKMMELKKTLH